MLKQPFSDIKNIVFDIGNVLVDIDFKAVADAFKKIAIADFSSIVSYNRQESFFDLFEKGKISAKEFRNTLRQFLKPNISDEEIDAAWNSILISYPPKKFELLQELKLHYRVLALSNTNEIHVAALNKAAKEKLGKEKFADFFHHAYYSNETGFRKPELEIYELMLQQQFLNPHETLFIDDKEENIEAAKALHIQVFHLTDRDKLCELFYL
ncbi:MAG: HAD family phosphatase [Chitinophagales bacterium]|nr:HAD family phosphatase [Chitinophagales bacterium]MCO5280367.1 HAD family phosphatase [Chitinophagales bacterium]OJV25629.1 MAG: hypothetical protein BGO32_01055 [Bacteroidetes bacterium 37-13]HRN94420.1 HAD family phosphatase [Chitinophagales bacterium]HRP38226.1 HAD family phosphatase [Chitinophagales bacterium]